MAAGGKNGKRGVAVAADVKLSQQCHGRDQQFLADSCPSLPAKSFPNRLAGIGHFKSLDA